MKITPSTTYSFELVCGPLKFTFSVPGDTEEAAKNMLIGSLKLAIAQLDGSIVAEEPAK